MAKFYVVQAEGEVDRASALKAQKVSFEKRTGHYAKACHLFLKAFKQDPRAFFLARIEMAADSCWKAGLEEEEMIFKAFADNYIQNHPKEYEYGDGGVALMDMGG